MGIFFVTDILSHFDLEETLKNPYKNKTNYL